jgi:hypothetical protein
MELSLQHAALLSYVPADQSAQGFKIFYFHNLSSALFFVWKNKAEGGARTVGLPFLHLIKQERLRKSGIFTLSPH